MRIVAVNHLHPQARHIGGVRVARFASALAERGHHVVLLTGPLDPDEGPADVSDVAARLANHDWHQPFLLACPLAPQRLLAAAREGRLPRPLRLAVLGGNYLFHGGVFTDWRQGSRQFWPMLAKLFRPEVTWATFGNTDAWAIARGIAHLSHCPWVMDIKDSWDAFIPRPLTPLLARCFNDAAGCTGLSQGYLDHSGRHFGGFKRVVYSGIPASLLAPAPPELPFRITITGSCYGMLERMVGGIGRFLDRLPAAKAREVVFTYAGGEHELAGRLASALEGRCRTDIRPFIALPELAQLQRQAFLNLYGRALGQPDFFHHKLFELLCADRPIACFPTEIPEAVGLAAAAAADFSRCGDEDALAALLERAWRRRTPHGTGVKRAVLAGYSWEAQAERLESALMAALAGEER
jgi:glycosyltransferase involved in cell wall biosynthesis